MCKTMYVNGIEKKYTWLIIHEMCFDEDKYSVVIFNVIINNNSAKLSIVWNS